MEITRKIVEEEGKLSYQRPDRRADWCRLAELYGEDRTAEQGDFSERLLVLVDRIVARGSSMNVISSTGEVTQLVYGEDIRPLNDALSAYVVAGRKDAIWVLVDNLDKSWPVQSARTEDILLIRSLLEASRKLQRQFENRGVECHTIVFIRNDIYAHLVNQSSDRGKDTAVILDWSDPDVFREVVRRRIIKSSGLDGDFDALWRMVFESHVCGEESFSYILSRTLMRPWEVLRFCRTCLDVAVSRGKDRVSERDILQAERLCSADALVDIRFELKDVEMSLEGLPDVFHGASLPLSLGEVENRIRKVVLTDEETSAQLNC